MTGGPGALRFTRTEPSDAHPLPGFADFDLITPDDPPAQPATEQWLAENQRGSHLDSTLTTFSFR